jgi:hypothetical protein
MSDKKFVLKKKDGFFVYNNLRLVAGFPMTNIPDEGLINARNFMASSKLIKACEAAIGLLSGMMDDCEKQDHFLDGHDGGTCVLCQLVEAVKLAKEGA